jgi:hypothetical protein
MTDLSPRRASPFIGQHCEAVATGTLLQDAGYALSEPMIFGLGEGIGFSFLRLSSLPLPFIGGRTRPFAVTTAACRNLGAELRVEETSSKAKAWRSLEGHLQGGRPVGLQVDCFYLPAFQNAPHFAGHFVAATGLFDGEVEIVDTVQQGSAQRVPRAALEAARHARGPMAARARSYTIHAGPPPDLAAAAVAAMRATGARYLTPEFAGMGSRGLAQLARSLPTWLDAAPAPAADLQRAADLMERAGTGGALFRNLYRDFLTDAADLLPHPSVRAAAREIADAATRWTEMAQLLEQCARDGRPQHLTEAARLCTFIAEHERAAMALLAHL